MTAHATRLDAVELTASQKTLLGKAAYRGFFGLTGAEADDAWERADFGPNVIGHTDWVSAAIEAVNALQWLPAEVRDHIATVLMGEVNV